MIDEFGDNEDSAFYESSGDAYRNDVLPRSKGTPPAQPAPVKLSSQDIVNIFSGRAPAASAPPQPVAPEPGKTVLSSRDIVNIFSGRMPTQEEPVAAPPKEKSLLDKVSGVVDTAISDVYGDNKPKEEQIDKAALAEYKIEQAEKAARIAATRASMGLGKDDAYATKLLTSAAGGLGAAVSSTLEWIGEQAGSDSLKKIGAAGSDFSAALTPEDQDLVQKVAGGVGSMLSFAVPGLGVAKGLRLLGMGVKGARSVASGVAATLESASVAQETYEKVMSETGNKQLANEQSWKAATINLPFTYFTNKLGVFGETGSAAKKIGTAFLMEGPVQEGGQNILTNVLGFKPAGEGYTEESLVGGLAGGGFKGGMIAVQKWYEKASPEQRDEIVQKIIDDGKTARREVFDAMMGDERTAKILTDAGITSAEDENFIKVAQVIGKFDRELSDFDNQEKRKATTRESKADVDEAFRDTASTGFGVGMGSSSEPVIKRSSVTVDEATKTLVPKSEAGPEFATVKNEKGEDVPATAPEDIVAFQQGFAPLAGTTIGTSPWANRFLTARQAQANMDLLQTGNELEAKLEAHRTKGGIFDKESLSKARTQLNDLRVKFGLERITKWKQPIQPMFPDLSTQEVQIREGKRSKEAGGGTFFFLEARPLPSGVVKPGRVQTTMPAASTQTTTGTAASTVDGSGASQGGSGTAQATAPAPLKDNYASGEAVGAPVTFDLNGKPVTVQVTAVMGQKGYAGIYKKPGAILGLEITGEGVPGGRMKLEEGVNFEGQLTPESVSQFAQQKATEALTKPKAEKAKATSKAKEASNAAQEGDQQQGGEQQREGTGGRVQEGGRKDRKRKAAKPEARTEDSGSGGAQEGGQESIDARRAALDQDLETIDDFNAKANALLGAEGGGTYRAVRVPVGTLVGKMPGVGLIQKAASLFGKEVIFYRVVEGKDFLAGGVIRAGKKIFVNVNSSKPHIRIVGHELVHALKRSNPAAYERLKNSLQPLLNEKGFADYSKWLESVGEKRADKILEEAIGDIVGDRFGESEFWQMMADRNPTGFKQFAREVINFIDNILKKIGVKTLGSETLVKDLKAARSEIARILSDVSAETGAVADGEISPSRKRDGVARDSSAAYVSQAELRKVRSILPDHPDAAEHLRVREMQLEKGTGGYRNERRVLEKDGFRFVIGPVTTQDWIDRVTSTLSQQEIAVYRHWYRDTVGEFKTLFGDSWPEYMIAYLLGNKAESPRGALNNALYVAENVRASGQNERKGGLSDAQMNQIFKGDVVSLNGIGAKLYDFVDSALGKTTRSWMGNAIEGASPFVVDRHTFRDSGRVDPLLKEWLERKFGAEAVRGIVLDTPVTGSVSNAQYEQITDWGNALADDLNSRGFAGGGVMPLEAQAIGWMAMTRLTETNAGGTTEGAVAGMTKTVAAELDFGSGAPYAKKFSQYYELPKESQKRVTHEALRELANISAEITGVRLTNFVPGVGGWGDSVTPNAVMQFLAADNTAEALVSAMGYLGQQTAVIALHPAAGATGNMVAFDISGTQMSDDFIESTLWKAVSKELEPMYGKDVGFMRAVMPDGRQGIRIAIELPLGKKANGEPKTMGDFSVPERAKLEGALVDKVKPAIQRALESLPGEYRIDYGRVKGVVSSNNWDKKGQEDGQGYRRGVVERFGPEVQGRLDSIGRPRFERAIEQALRAEYQRIGKQSPAAPDSRGVRQSGGVRGGAVPLEVDGRKDPRVGEPLEGGPRQVAIPRVGLVRVGKFQPAVEAARAYMARAGLQYNPPKTFARVDPDRARRIADEYDRMAHAPGNPEVRAAYDAMIAETIAQYRAILDTGLQIEFIDFEKTGDPYAASPRLAIQDVIENNHLWVFSTADGFGSNESFTPDQNPLLRDTGFAISGKPALANDLFRVVHDYFGHVKNGVGFRADGEENAWRAHSAMYSPLARRAMTSETRGQNSWVNFGPKADSNRGASAANTQYADQKTGLLPDWVSEEGADELSPSRVRETLQSEPSVEETGGTESAAFQRWFGKSKITDGEGNPEVWYHGTARDIVSFIAKQAGAIFVTKQPRFAEGFTSTSEDFMRKEMWNAASPEQRRAWIREATAIAYKNGNIDSKWRKKTLDELKESEANGVTYDSIDRAPSSVEADLLDLMNEKLASRANIIPVYVRAESPFDFENPDHIKALRETESGRDLYDEEVAIIKRGAWTLIEKPHVQRAIKQAGFDSFYVVEGGTKNLAVYQSNQLKSVFNQGTWSESDELSASRVRETVAEAVSSAAVPGRLAQAVRDRIASAILPNGEQRFNWWHKSIGTQLEKARTNPYYRKVYDLGQKFLDDAAMFAMRAQAAAPTILPNLGNMGLKFWKGGISKANNELLGKMLAEGTLLNGPSPMNGKVWTDAELRSRYNATDEQIKLYREARAAIDQSLDDTAKSLMGQLARSGGIPQSVITPLIEGQLTLTQMRDRLVKALGALPPSGKTQTAISGVKKMAAETEALKKAGYSPLMRFGEFVVSVENKNGEIEYFSLHETAADALRTRNEISKQFKGPGFKISNPGARLNSARFKMFAGLSPSTLEAFFNAAPVTSKAEENLRQEYLQLVVSNRSALARMIQRKGTAGYNIDATRTLASFITSNARHSSKALNMAEMTRAITEIPQDQGDVANEAVKLMEYLQNPQEGVPGIRGFLFFNFLGGSVAAGLVNMTQPVLMTYPYLAQWGAAKAGGAMTAAMKNATAHLLKKSTGNAALDAALKKAAERGITQPQEMFQLMAAAESGTSSLLGHKFMRVWGLNFAVSEVFNRVVTFTAAFNLASGLSQAELQKAGVKDAYEFAVRTVEDTQGKYNKGNRPNWARETGVLGSAGTLMFTFKQYSIAYLEFLKQLYKNNNNGKKALGIALASLILAAGISGLPGADDLDDIIDTVGNWMGYPTNSKKWKTKFLTETLGMSTKSANFLLYGISSFLPMDLQARLGLANLIPGTGLLNPTKDNKAREVLDVLGPVGGFAASASEALEMAGKGNYRGAGLKLAPKAVKDAVMGVEMATTGKIKDEKGRVVQDATPTDALVKGIGFNPQSVASESRVQRMIQADIDIVKSKKEELHDMMARSIVDRDPELRAKAMDELRRWNSGDPEYRIMLDTKAIQERIKKMIIDRSQRFAQQAPKAMRARVMQELQQEKASRN